MGPIPVALLEQLQQLRRSFSEDLPARISKIEEAWHNLASGHWNTVAAKNLRSSLHSMAGSAGTFGFKQTGLQARAAETGLDALLATSSTPTPEQLGELSEAIIALSRMAASEQPQPLTNDSATGAAK